MFVSWAGLFGGAAGLYVTCADSKFLFSSIDFLSISEHGKLCKSIDVTRARVLTDKLKCLLKVLFDVLVRRVIGRYLFVSDARFVLGRRWLTGDVENTIGSDARRINGVATVAEQQVRKNGRCWMRFNICKGESCEMISQSSG